MHYFLKIRANPDNPAYSAMNKFDQATKQLYTARPNGRGGMIRPPIAPVGLRMKAVMKEVEIDTSRMCPITDPDHPPGTLPEHTCMIQRVITSLRGWLNPASAVTVFVK